MNSDPKKEPQVPEWEPEAPFMVMREGFLAREDTSSVRNMHSAGLNAYGDFVIKAWCGDLIVIPNHERARLAAYLLSPWVETDQPEKIGWVRDANERTALRVQHAAAKKKVDSNFATEPPELREQKRRPGGKGIVAKP